MGLEIVELILHIEDEFKIQIPDTDGKIGTVGGLHQLVMIQLKQQGMPADEDVVLQRICQLIAATRLSSVGKITRDTRFVEDLGFG